MLEVRKGKVGEEKEVLEVCNRAFIPHRNKDFDFTFVMPKIYNNNLNFSELHHVVLEDNKMIAAAGNLFDTIEVDSKSYKFSILGSVATVPSSEGKGAMKLMLSSVDEENERENVVFGALTGARKRYNYYGYEQAATRLSFYFTPYFVSHYEGEEIELREFDKKDLDTYYSYYLKYQPVHFRKKENFEVSLKKRDTKIFGVYKDKEFKGYVDFSLCKSWISELSLDDVNLVGSVIKKIVDLYKVDELEVMVSPLNIRLVEALDKIAERSEIYDYIHLKVYDLRAFLEMLISLNMKTKKFEDLHESYKVGDELISISIEDNELTVSNDAKFIDKTFKDKKEFLRYIFGIQNVYFKASKLFPLFFDINEADLF